MTSARQPVDPANQTPMAHAPAPMPTGSAGDGNLAEPMPLGMFLQGIATIYDLAPKAIKKVVKRPTPRTTPREKFSRPLAAALALSFVALFAVRLSNARVQGALPFPLRGEWTTTNPGYSDRRFSITSSQLTFKIGLDADSVTVHPIRHVTQTAVGEDTTNFVVEYEVEGALATWAFEYVQRPKPVIRFHNQKEIVWTQVPEAK